MVERRKGEGEEKGKKRGERLTLNDPSTQNLQFPI